MRNIKRFVFLGVAFGLLNFGGSMPGTAIAASQEKCAVLSGNVDKKVFVDYKGKRIYFCCAGCIEQFNKDPEKYLKKMEAEGITPEKTP